MDKYIVTHRRVIHGCELLNLVPQLSSTRHEKQQRIWRGNLVVEELMKRGVNDLIPRYVLRFESYGNKQFTFCTTVVMSSLKDFEFVIRKVMDCRFYICVYCNCMNIVLELRILNGLEEQKFRDIWYRMRDEFEMMDERFKDRDIRGIMV
ncbi:HEL229Cp [Eremothecium sinecaudum]|uniref:HEL229Cp n=1 Tax=Eremothecium sinecaudum TaxID=45286 RepID=A0A0X8HT63_9SACH|nr:HEL229Cp [Eremothecium sinecaudum]AMD21052.1 HEL229Cp [Eremothecium sinecaudum]